MNRAKTRGGYQPIVMRDLDRGDVHRIGILIGQNISGGTTVALYGELGTGKTTLIQAICEGLGVVGRVTSPTFTIVNAYRGNLPVYHIDLYRLEGPAELQEIGWEDMIREEAVCLVEWAEKAAGLLGSPRLDIEIDRVSEETRDVRFSFTGNGGWAEVYRAIRDRAEARS